jgi:integrase
LVAHCDKSAQTSRQRSQWRTANVSGSQVGELRHFGAGRLCEITVRDVDRYRHAQLREGRLSASYVDATLTRLAQILELTARNPAAGRRRRARTTRPRPAQLDGATQIVALLDATAALDAAATVRMRGHRALLATLVFAGLRFGEARALAAAQADPSLVLNGAHPRLIDEYQLADGVWKGPEVDAIVEATDGRWIAIEVNSGPDARPHPIESAEQGA